jgi:glycosyltransferase involved in cell wall biosynthesis
LKIAVVTTSFLPRIGGAEFAIHHLAREWSSQGHDVVVVNAVTDRVWQEGAGYGVRAFRLPRGASRFGAHRPPFSWIGTRRIGAILRELAPDAISAHFGYPVAIWISRLEPLPRFLITCHGPALNESPSGPRRRFGIDATIAEALNRSAGVVAISGEARRIMERIGVDSARIVDIPNGVDTLRFGIRVEGSDLRRRFGIPAGAPVILSVGRESWAKAYEDGIQAFAKVAARHPSAHYLIVGRGTDAWRPFSRELEVADRLHFVEGLFGDELVAAYQQADVFFLPSVKELCPLVVPEAMAAGLPQVVTDVSGSQDMVRAGHNGLVVPPREPESMARALLELLRDPELRGRMREAALTEAAQYSWTRLSRLYLEHL